MGMDSGNSGDGPSGEINVTPLVDVCLVLLIIFMVMTPKTVPEISVRLPPEKKSNARPSDNDTLVVGLGKDGGVTLNRTPLNSRDDLEEKLRNLLQNRDKKVVFIDFDDEANYREAIGVLDVSKRAGAQVLGIMKKKGEPTPDRLPLL